MPALTGTRTFHFVIISLQICRLAPLSGFRRLLECRGLWHLRNGLHHVPSEARCFGHTIILFPFRSNNPTQAKMRSFFSEIADAQATFSCRRWDLVSLVHEDKGKYHSSLVILAKNYKCCWNVKRTTMTSGQPWLSVAAPKNQPSVTHWQETKPRTLIYLCLLFIATVFTLAWLKDLYLQKCFTKVTENNFICCRM